MNQVITEVIDYNIMFEPRTHVRRYICTIYHRHIYIVSFTWCILLYTYNGMHGNISTFRIFLFTSRGKGLVLSGHGGNRSVIYRCVLACGVGDGEGAPTLRSVKRNTHYHLTLQTISTFRFVGFFLPVSYAIPFSKTLYLHNVTLYTRKS